jgi:hypothetical protein
MNFRRRSLLPLLVVGACVALGLASSAASHRAEPGPLHIHNLSGSLFTMGRWSGGPLLWVRLRAHVCLRSRTEALNSYPSEIRITHFAVWKSRGRWWPARTVIDHAPWLVPFGETWRGACGNVTVEDPIPPEHYGVESLGNPNMCYGVALTLKTRTSSATKRAIIACRFGG